MDISGEKCNYEEGDIIPQGEVYPHTVFTEDPEPLRFVDA
jgi:hypothetical protein